MGEKIEQLLAMNDADLFMILAGALPPEGSAAAPSVERARKWFQENTAQFRQVICGSHVVKTYLESERADNRILLVAAIADLIASICTGIAAITVAVMIVKEGL
jgi:hypothetical protein